MSQNSDLSIEEYILQTPLTEGEPEIESSSTIPYFEKQAQGERVEELKRAIDRQVKEAIEPQYILLSALDLIGALTNNNSWSDKNKETIIARYGEIRQQSLLIDNATIDSEITAQAQAEYLEHLRKRLNSEYYRLKNIIKAYEDIFQQLPRV